VRARGSDPIYSPTDGGRTVKLSGLAAIFAAGVLLAAAIATEGGAVDTTTAATISPDLLHRQDRSRRRRSGTLIGVRRRVRRRGRAHRRLVRDVVHPSGVPSITMCGVRRRSKSQQQRSKHIGPAPRARSPSSRCLAAGGRALSCSRVGSVAGFCVVVAPRRARGWSGFAASFGHSAGVPRPRLGRRRGGSAATPPVGADPVCHVGQGDGVVISLRTIVVSDAGRSNPKVVDAALSAGRETDRRRDQ
jgi:hypothetical protein